MALGTLLGLGDSTGYSGGDFNWGGLIGGLAGAALGGKSSDKPAGQTTTTQAPWGPQQPYLTDLYSKAQQQSQYGGQLTPDQIAAQTEMGKWASGENYNPMLGLENPYLTKSVNDASTAAMRNLQPMINRANAASGSFGNSGVAETYGRTAADQLGTIANNAYMGDYYKQQGLYENDANRRMSGINSFLGQANMEQQLPWQNLNQYRSAISGSPGSATSTPYFTNTAANVLGGAGAGTWLGNQLAQGWGA